MFGHGCFIYDPDYAISKFGSAQKAVQALKSMNMSHAWIRGHNKNGLWKIGSNQKIVEALRGEGLSVGVWGWCDGNNVNLDVRNMKKAVQVFEPDCYIADIEPGESGSSWNPLKAQSFGSQAREFLGEMPFVVSSFGYISWHQPQVMAMLDTYADYFAPQVYWFWFPNQQMLDQTPLSGLRVRNPADYARACIFHWRQTVSKPLVITGQAYWGEHSSWTRALAEDKLKEFLDDFNEFDQIAGLNWWNFAADKSMSQSMVDLIREAGLGGNIGGGRLGARPITGRVSSRTRSVIVTEQEAGLHWIAAEGLKFRTSPDNSDDDNVEAELDYGSSAYVKGGQSANGYLPVTVPLDGIDADGFLFAKYLRKDEHPQVERAIQEAVSEWIRFDKGAGLEHKAPYSGYINEMWTARGYPDLTGQDRGWFWSAAFISWVLENAGYLRTRFDIRHSTYIHESIQNRVLEREGDFVGYRLEEVRPQVGDILCQWRGDYETTFDKAETQSRFESHTDLVIAVRDRVVITLGGNVANAHSNGAGVSVETKEFRLNSSGVLVDERRLFAVMKNQFRPRSEQAILSSELISSS